MAAPSKTTKRAPLTAAQKKSAAEKRKATMAAKAAAARRSMQPEEPVLEGPTSAAAWKKGSQGEDLRVPSGNVCRLRKISMREWVTAGIIPDSLMGIVDKAIAKGQGLRVQDQKKLLEDVQKDPTKMAEYFELMDRVVALAVAKPTVVFHRRPAEGEQRSHPSDPQVWEDIPEDERDPDILYTDDLDDMDKTYIFNVAAGGVRDLERFRQQFGAGMAALQRGEDLVD